MPADLAVIGLGHLGLPLAQAATAAGVRTVGYDPDERAIGELRAGRLPTPGSLTAAEIRRMLSVGFRPTADPRELGPVRTAVICAPTPATDDGRLDLSAVGEAARDLADQLRAHTTVVLESTVYPGATEEYLRPLLERGSGLRAGRDFHLACSPGRLDPGSRRYPYADIPKVIGGLTPACTEAAATFYGRLTDRVVRARGTREAEMVKVLESNYQHVNIALVNEMAMYCHELSVDLWDVIRCAETKPFGFQAFRPGPGVGGHGGALAPGRFADRGQGHSFPVSMVELAETINNRMPRYISQRCAALLNEHGKAARGAQVLLLGVNHQADVSDQHGSPANEVARHLMGLGARLSYHDPRVPHWRVAGRQVPRAEALYDAAAAADLTVLLQHHRTYDPQGLAVKAQLLLDTRGASPTGAAHRL